MKIKIGKLLRWIIELSLCCGYFYVLFINLVCGFCAGGIRGKEDFMKILAVSFLLAAGLPGIVWYQHGRIRKLKKKLERKQQYES